MKITDDIIKAAQEKAMRMPLGSYSRLFINNEESDIVISPSSSGIYFYDSPGTITANIVNQLIGFKYYEKQ